MNCRIAYSTLFLYVLQALTATASAESFTGKVVGISDGATIRIMRDGKEAKIRLNGVDCPESGQDFGSKAKLFTSKLCFGREVNVDVRDTDRYGRTVGEVNFKDGRDLDQELVKAGLAWWYRQYAPNDVNLQKLEAEARAAKLGLLSPPNPIAPWDSRRGGAPSVSGNPPPVTPPSTGPSSDRATATSDVKQSVYVTATGSKYHANGCRYLAKSKVPMALEVASGAFGPCSACNPPVLDQSNAPAPVTFKPKTRGPPAVVAPVAQAPPHDDPPAYEAAPAYESAPQPDADIVHATNTGAKYHAAGCRYLKSDIPMSRIDAQARRLGPCSVCRP